MRILRAALLGSLWLSLPVLPASAQSSRDWVDVKDADELRALYSNKTHRSRAFVGHYRADGEGILLSAGSDIRHPRTWQLRGSDQVCVGPKGDTPTCFRYQRSTKNAAEVLATGEKNGQRVMLWFTVEDGIPKF
jgi:hypothetical protein